MPFQSVWEKTRCLICNLFNVYLTRSSLEAFGDKSLGKNLYHMFEAKFTTLISCDGNAFAEIAIKFSFSELRVSTLQLHLGENAVVGLSATKKIVIQGKSKLNWQSLLLRAQKMRESWTAISWNETNYIQPIQLAQCYKWYMQQRESERKSERSIAESKRCR